MFRVSDLAGLPVLKLGTKKQLCTVKNAVLDTTTNRIFALVCKESMLHKHMDIIPYKNIIILNTNHVIIEDQSCIRTIASLKKGTKQLSDCENIIRNMIINNNGDILGVITDIYFDKSNGNVISFEMSEGYFDDILSGRKVVKSIGRTV